MSPAALRRWDVAHTWSSLVCTLFLLVLCLSGLPLVFSHEIAEATGTTVQAPALAAPTPRAALGRIVRAAERTHPGLVPLYFFAEADEPDVWLVKMDTRVDTDESRARFAAVDARTAEVLGTPRFDTGFMALVYRLHVDLFAGLAGKLFLGTMGMLFLTAIVSGIVLYAPFMGRLAFGAIRSERGRRVRWLDLHNLTGIAVAAWLLVVGATGVVNTWSELILQDWQKTQVAALHDERRVTTLLPALAGPAPADAAERAFERALQARPGMAVATVAFPGTLLSTPGHFAFLLHGDTPLTARLTETVLVDAANGSVVQAAARPLLVTLLQLAQPLHFGDYAGLPLKLLWALLDAVAIIVLVSGVILWWQRIRAQRRRGLAAG